MGALLVIGSIAVSVFAGLGLTRGLLTLMLAVLPSIHSIRSGPADAS